MRTRCARKLASKLNKLEERKRKRKRKRRKRKREKEERAGASLASLIRLVPDYE
jgi:hypothetical protein